jgi:CubicO group peptidase (beta-lactamase class C family)
MASREGGEVTRALRFLLVILLCPLLAGAAETDGDALVGLWAAELDYSPALRGTLTLDRHGTRWTARMMDEAQSFTASGRDLDVRLPGGHGRFRGRLSPDGGTIEGFWLQPAGGTADRQDPGGAGQAFATPTRLGRVTPNRWRGEVTPLDNHFILYLKVFRQGDRLLGAFRNPNMNSNGGASQFEVARSGDSVRFSVRYDGGEIAHDATFLRGPDRLRLEWPDLGRSVELTRRSADEAESFFPRPPNAPPYVYRRPPETGDGWRTAAAADTGFDETALAAIVLSIAASDPAARPPSLIHSLLVAHGGRLVLEEYFFGYGRDVPHDLRSAGKTFGSVLLGAAMMHRYPLSPETGIYDVFRRRGPFANPDVRKDSITLGHLMTHSSGLACNDNDDASPGNENRMQSQGSQPDWWRYTLDLPMAHDPGTRYAYCSANSNLVGGALTLATGTWLPQLFDEWVARPLQFGRYHWNLMPNDEGYLGGGAFLRPRDLLKIGQAFLDGGVWNGRRIVDAAWTLTSTAPRIEINEATTGLSADEFGNYYGHGQDALAWHLGTLVTNGRTYRTYAAGGNGGQVLLVLPELDLAVVYTGGNYGQGGVWGRWGQQIVGDRIIPALR